MNNETEQCIFCKKFFLKKHIYKHEYNCPKQLTVLIGPDYEQVNCQYCHRIFYKDVVTKYQYKNNKLVKMIVYGIDKHIKKCMKFHNEL